MIPMRTMPAARIARTSEEGSRRDFSKAGSPPGAFSTIVPARSGPTLTLLWLSEVWPKSNVFGARPRARSVSSCLRPGIPVHHFQCIVQKLACDEGLLFCNIDAEVRMKTPLSLLAIQSSTARSRYLFAALVLL